VTVAVAKSCLRLFLLWNIPSGPLALESECACAGRTMENHRLFYSTVATSGTPISASEQYKALRSAELLAYREVLRASLMQAPGAMGRRYRRVLEELEELLHIDTERSALELVLAEADPLVAHVRQSNVAAQRGRFVDALGEIPLEDSVAESDDGGKFIVSDRRSPLTTAVPVPPPTLPRKDKRPAGLVQPPKSQPTGLREDLQMQTRVNELGAQIQAAAFRMITTKDKSESITLRLALKAFDRELDELLKKLP
jgi:hypothetical protein